MPHMAQSILQIRHSLKTLASLSGAVCNHTHPPIRRGNLLRTRSYVNSYLRAWKPLLRFLEQLGFHRRRLIIGANERKHAVSEGPNRGELGRELREGKRDELRQRNRRKVEWKNPEVALNFNTSSAIVSETIEVDISFFLVVIPGLGRKRGLRASDLEGVQARPQTG